MATRNQTNAEFRSEVQEILGRHESTLDQVHKTLQAVLTELQSLRASQASHAITSETNPFAPVESSHQVAQPATSNTSFQLDRNHHLKLFFPNFNGEDPTGWIYKAEQFFEFKNVALAQQVQLASFHLEGIALQWHRWLTKFRGPLTWEEFTKALQLRFGPTDYEDPSEALTRLKQISTVSQYQESFEKLSHRVDHLPETFLVGCFIAGLQDDIRLDVKIKQPTTLTDAIGVARLIEERNSLQKKTSSTSAFGSSNLPHFLQNSSTPSAGLLGPSPTQKKLTTTATPVQRISGQEARERREKGLCFYCDEKYAPGHRCQRPQFFMIEDCPPPLEPDEKLITEELALRGNLG